MSVISEAQFVDLYLGVDFCDVKGLDGASAHYIEAPATWQVALETLRLRCNERFAADQDPEFSIIEDGVVLRVTQLLDAHGQTVFVLNKSNAIIRDFQYLGFPDEVVAALLNKQQRGLVMFCGESGTGKTSSAASLVVARLQACGGIAFAVEDPQETNLHGPHGQGRCIQVQVSRRTGGYEEALLRSLRARADQILIGEMRDTPTAAQTVRAAINGYFMITTLHAGSIEQGIERLASTAQPEIPNAREILAQGLIAVIWQTIESGVDGRRQLKSKSLLLTGQDGPGIREKIRTGHIELIAQDVENQSKRSLWT